MTSMGLQNDLRILAFDNFLAEPKWRLARVLISHCMYICSKFIDKKG